MRCYWAVSLSDFWTSELFVILYLRFFADKTRQEGCYGGWQAGSYTVHLTEHLNALENGAVYGVECRIFAS
jgi:hypothetical protein